MISCLQNRCFFLNFAFDVLQPGSHPPPLRPLLKRSITIFRFFFFFGLASSSFLRGVLDHYDLLPSHPLRRCMLSNIVTTPDGRYKSRTSYLLIALKYQIIFDVVKFRLFLRGEACGEKLAKYSSFLRNRDHFYAQVKIENVLNKV